MTDLRKLMLEELERRNYSRETARAYVAAVEDFARYFHRRPDQLGPDHIRQYQAYLFRERKLTANSVTQRLGALRFLSRLLVMSLDDRVSRIQPEDRAGETHVSANPTQRTRDRYRYHLLSRRSGVAEFRLVSE
jgi:hypothetical protein